jgi:anti-sigma factor RsiW
MRCSRAEPLIERFVDGQCGPAETRAIEAHALTCARCTARIASARALVAEMGRAPAVHAPRGFAAKVMEGVYRQALAGQPAEEPRVPARTVNRMYRRLAFSFMITAGVLTASLVIPRVAYPTLIARGSEAGIGGSAAVQSVLAGADKTVRGILGEQQVGGSGQ